MWNEMLRIGEYEEELVTTLSPQVIKDFNQKWFEIEVRLDRSYTKCYTLIGFHYINPLKYT